MRHNCYKIKASKEFKLVSCYILIYNMTRLADSPGRPGPVLSQSAEDTLKCIRTFELQAADRRSLKYEGGVLCLKRSTSGEMGVIFIPIV